MSPAAKQRWFALLQLGFVLLVIVLVMWLLTGCQGGGGLSKLNPFTWFTPPPPEQAKIPADATQTQIAWTVAAPLGGAASLLLLSGIVLWWMGAGPRAFQSIAFGVLLILVNGMMITFLKSRWTMIVLVGSAAVTVALLYMDARDGIMGNWRKPKPKEATT